VVVRGRGILDGTQMPHPSFNLVHLQRARNVRIEGIILRNSPNWHLPIFDSDHVEVDGLCCISGRLNSDGVNCVNSRDVFVHDTFVRTHDDSFAVKTTSADKPSHGIRYERCVAWDDWGYAFGVTYETRADISDVVYRNCDMLFSRHWALGVHVADGGTVRDILFENITLEYPRSSLAEGGGRVILKIDNDKDCWSTDSRTGRIEGVTVRNVSVNGELDPIVEIRGNDPGHKTRDVLLENITLRGAPLSQAVIRKNEHVENLVVR
jgi:polygalacturonase